MSDSTKTRKLTEHPQAHLVPDMRPEEYAALRDDISRRGILTPLEITTNGTILDGRHRYRVAIELGLAECPTRIAQLNGTSQEEYMIRAALLRRHMSDDQRAALALRWQKAQSAQALSEAGKQGGRGNKKPSDTVSEGFEPRDTRTEAANLFAVPERKVRYMAQVERAAPELMGEIEAGNKTISEARREVKKRLRDDDRKAAAKSGSQKTKIATEYRLICADVADGMQSLDPSSIDVIITDPPYPREYLELYEIMAREAARVLKPGALAVVMCGQSYLPDLLQLLTKNLRYHWTGAYLTPGGQSPQLFSRKVNTFWKPVVILSNGEYTGGWFGDVSKSAVNDNDKDRHDWGQSESGIADLVSKHSEPGQIILDPFTGSSTTGVCALRLGRQFIGIDSDQQQIDISAERLSCMK